MASLKNEGIRFSSVGPESAAILADIHAACFPNYWDAAAFNDFFGVAGTQAILAYEKSPVGMLVYRISHEQADIMTIAVLPTYRRRGIARALMDMALKELMQSGVKTLFLDVEDGNEPAARLYEGLGFAVQRRRRLYYRQKDGSCTDALVMTKKFS